MPTPDRASWVCLPLPTELGLFSAWYSQRGLAELRFPPNKPASAITSLPSPSSQTYQWHRVTSDAVSEILAGRKPNTFPPFDLSSGTEFQQNVWRAMMRIPFGQTSSYGKLASAIGKPKAVRAVGGACGANPIPLLVPCHRVLAAKNKIGGFSGGLDWKRRLLVREGVRLL